MEESSYSLLQHDPKSTTTPFADDVNRAGYESLEMPVKKHTERAEIKPSMEYSIVRRKDGKKVSLHMQAKK